MHCKSGIAPWLALVGVLALSACGDDRSQLDGSGDDPVNQAPVARAGDDQRVPERTAVILDGAASSDVDGQIVAYRWVQTAGPAVALDPADGAQARFVAPDVNAATSLRFELTVTDDAGAQARDSVAVDVIDVPGNRAPQVDAGADRSVAAGDSVSLSGTAHDDDGTIATYAWTQTDGPAVELQDADRATAQFVAPALTTTQTLRFTFSATDDEGATGSDSVNVTVNAASAANQAPVADAGADRRADDGETVVLDGHGSDADGRIVAYVWTQTGGPAVALDDAASATPSFVAPTLPATSALQFALQVRDDAGATSPADTVTITVNAAPALSVADAHAGEADGTLQFVVSLSAASAQTVQFDYRTADGTATGGQDYDAVSGTQQLAPGTTTATIRVPLHDDGEPEAGETLSLQLSAPRHAVLARAQATGTIDDDDDGSTPPDEPPADAGYGDGLLGALAQFTADDHVLITALLNGDAGGAGTALQNALAHLGTNLAALGGAAGIEQLIGLNDGVPAVVLQTLSARRDVEAVVVQGGQLPGWSVPAAAGLPRVYPSGAYLAQCPSPLDAVCDPVIALLDKLVPGSNAVRDAHNGTLLYPLPGLPATAGIPVDEIAAYAWRDGAWTEIPVQVDERFPYFLANGNSTFSIYSGTDQELSYVWDPESWGMTQGSCEKTYDRNGRDDGVNQGVASPTQDPVPGLDADDEIVFMARDAGVQAPAGARPAGIAADAPVQQVALVDLLAPAAQRYVYLFRKAGGSAFRGRSHYVHYQRDADADQWIDRYRFADDDPQKLGTSNTNYGANLTGPVCVAQLSDYHGDARNCVADAAAGGYRCASTDRFARDGVTVTTDTYRWRASGRWMVRELHVKKPDGSGYGPDLIDRWKGRAFQQSPDSVISLVGFEDEQVNWEANASLLGERCGPVRCIREVWGADSGTNVTKTETFYRDAIAYRYRLRVHPIPPDGLYTSWDYNRSAMVPTPEEAAAGVPGGRYFTLLRPQGVPIDGVNDDIGNVDGFMPLFGQCPSFDDGGLVPPNSQGRCPAFVDVTDPAFNLPLAFDNWEQVSGKGDSGSLVYTFVLRGATSLTNPLVVPYYRDDACLDDGTGDDPVQRPWPGDNSDSDKVKDAYVAAARARTGNRALQYGDLGCADRQGAYASNGLHFFVTQDSDNLFTPLTATEVDGEQWQFIVPTAKPQNIASPYANVARIPLLPVATPLR
ncbi:MAG TPA: PKD domain-containing protein [Solimonas sp.]|nr:PKD domain-containing protein [Solimonas sp.]